MLQNFTETDKKRLGFFIEYKRKAYFKNDRDRYAVDFFINGICSKQDYEKICHGDCIGNDEVYEKLLAKFDMQFICADTSSPQLKEKQKHLIDLLNDGETAMFHQLLESMMPELKTEYVFEEALYACLHIIRKDVLDGSDMRNLMQLFFVLDDMGKELCGYTMLSYVYGHADEEFTYEKLEPFHLDQLQAPCNQLNYLNLLMRWDQNYDAAACCAGLLLQYQGTGTQMEYHLLVCRLSIIMAIQSKSFKHYEEELNTFVKTHKVNDDEYSYEYYHIAGFYYYTHDRWDIAWDYFLKAVRSEKLYFPEILFLNHIATAEDRDLPDELKQTRSDIQANEIFMNLYRYFCQKHANEPLDQLESCLCEVYQRYASQIQDIWFVKDLMNDELDWIAQQSGSRESHRLDYLV